MPGRNREITPRGLLGTLFFPSLLDVFFCALLAAAFAQPAGVRSLLSDGDTGWHIRTGELVLATRHIPETDPFSFSRAREPWFAWEWLSDVSLALVWRWRGLAGVAAFTGAMLALSAMLLLARMLRSGSGIWIGVAVSMTAVSASSVHYLARPHAFSILLYTIALWLLYEDRVRPGAWVWTMVPLTAVWVNLHGGFTAWLVTVALAAVESATRGAWRQAKRYGLLMSGCAVASLANPYGWHLHRHIAAYLSSSWIMDHVAEFQSPLIRSEGMIVFAACYWRAWRWRRGRIASPPCWCCCGASSRCARRGTFRSLPSWRPRLWPRAWPSGGKARQHLRAAGA